VTGRPTRQKTEVPFSSIAFTLRDYQRFNDDAEELIFVEDTGLGSLDGGVWPCGDGGLHGNPVVARGRDQGVS